MTNAAQRVSKAVSRTQRVWMACMAVVVVAFLFSQYPLSGAFYVIGVGAITYFAAITLTIMAYSKGQGTDDDDGIDYDNNPLLKQLQADLKAGLIEPGSEEMFQRMREIGMHEILPIGRVSDDQIVGSYNGHTIYEWVEIKDPSTGDMLKFTYHSPGHYENDGLPIMPVDDRYIFAHVNGIVYAREA